MSKYKVYALGEVCAVKNKWVSLLYAERYYKVYKLRSALILNRIMF